MLSYLIVFLSFLPVCSCLSVLACLTLRKSCQQLHKNRNTPVTISYYTEYYLKNMVLLINIKPTSEYNKYAIGVFTTTKYWYDCGCCRMIPASYRLNIKSIRKNIFCIFLFLQQFNQFSNMQTSSTLQKPGF